MKEFLLIAKALGDENRLRALLALRNGELCLCQLIELLQLAPSTISKHMDVLYVAGLVTRRKEGRWQYYTLAGKDASPIARQAVKWVIESLADEKAIVGDDKRLCCVKKRDLVELTTCYQRN